MAKDIKAFRKRFKKDNGKDPSKKDMAKEPGMLAKYETWLSFKSGQSSSSSLKAMTDGTQRQKVDKTSSSNQMENGNLSMDTESEHQYAMAPPPVTPKKKVQKTNFDIGNSQSFRTPTRSSKAYKEEIKESIENSGGSVRSIIELPITPSRRSPSKKYFSQSPSSPSSSHFDDGTSPSKLRTLIDSFSATRSRGVTTPTKSKIQASRALKGMKEDEKLASQLHSSYHTKDAKMNERQKSSTYTPRTKARKRLRGEIVITPGKTPQKSAIGERQQITPTKVQRPPKRQRGMGTLQDFGLIPNAGPQAKMKLKDTVSSIARTAQLVSHDDVDDDEDDDEEDLIGPSPSTHRIIDVQVQSSFRPLFGNPGDLFTDLDEHDELERDEHEHDTDMRELQSSQTDLTHSGHGTDTALTTPAEENAGADMDSDEEERMYLRDYSRRFTPSDHYNRQSNAHFGNKENLDDVIDEEEDGMLLSIGLPATKRHFTPVKQSGNDSDEENLFENLSIHSPQGKRARQYQIRANAKRVRNLLQADQIFDKATSLATKEANEDSKDEKSRENGEKINASTHLKSKKEQSQIFSSKTKTARMMRGKVTKAQHRSLAAAEAMEEVDKELIGQKDSHARNLAPSVSSKQGKKSVILRRGREDDSEDEGEEEAGEDFASDNGPGYEDDDDRFISSATRRAHEDEEWASDVDSAEYGLGDGYMDEMDVI